MRKTHGISVEKTIVILDEAHNIVSIIISIGCLCQDHSAHDVWI